MSRCRFRAEQNGPTCLELRDHSELHRLPDGRCFPLDARPWRPAQVVLVDEAGHPVEVGNSDVWIHAGGARRDCKVVRELLALRWKASNTRDDEDLDTMRGGLSWESRSRLLPQEVVVSD